MTNFSNICESYFLCNHETGRSSTDVTPIDGIRVAKYPTFDTSTKHPVAFLHTNHHRDMRSQDVPANCTLNKKNKKTEEAVSDITAELASSRRSLRTGSSKDMLCLKKKTIGDCTSNCVQPRYTS